MLKFDLADGYYRVHLSPEAALELAVVLPGPTPTQRLIGIPLSLLMGWAYSPPYFCAFTETAADLANRALDTQQPPPWHPLVTTSQLTDLPLPQATAFSTLAVHPPNLQHAQPLSYVDIYIDDFLAVAQRSSLLPTLSHTLHGIFSSFHDTQHDRDAPSRQHIISQKKLLKGDAAWSTSKLILGCTYVLQGT